MDDSDDSCAVAELARTLDGAVEAALGAWDVMEAIGPLVRSGQAEDAQVTVVSLLLSAAEAGVRYRLVFRDERAAFAPMLELPDGTSVPNRIEDQPDDVVVSWLALQQAVRHPALKSRYGHLVVLAERAATGRQRMDLGRETGEGYLALAGLWRGGMDEVDALRAALSLARMFGLQPLQSAAIAAMVAAANAGLALSEPAPGIVLRLTHSLMGLRDCPGEVDAILAAALDAYKDDPHNADDVFAQQLARASRDTATQDEIWRNRVQSWLDAAERIGGATAALFLNKAVELAEASGSRDLREAATARMQEIEIEQWQMMGIRAELLLTHQEVAAVLQPMTDAATWQEALDAFALLGPPTGETGANRHTVEENAAAFPLSRLFPSTKVGGDGLIRFTASTPEEQVEHDLAQQELFLLQLRAPLVAEGLLRMRIRFGYIDVVALTAHFVESGVVPVELGSGLARAYQRWWAGDYEGAAFTAIPRIEALARQLLLATNFGIYRIQRQASPGQYPGLGWLLSKLFEEQLITEDWYRYIKTALASAAGANLRNEVSHGLTTNVDLVWAVVVLQCATHLALLPRTWSARPVDSVGPP